MTVRVRFAPSPTGNLHIGGARTAMYNYLFAKAMGGKYILRIEDTDLDRSSREHEVSQIKDLAWLGIKHHEGPDIGGEYGPYRQSERGHIYKAWSQKLLDQGKAFYCFCTEEELAAKVEYANANKLAPHYDGKCKKLTPNEVKAKLEAKEKAVIRFSVPKKAYEFNDHVRGKVIFPDDMVGDFVIVRASGIPVYNFAVVVDDASMKITHVIRAEEHLPNTLRQLMLYEAFNEKAPDFAHCSLLIGEDRQKLSKRHGATSTAMYKDMHYLPQALLNYLCLLGWSHPEEKDVFNIEDLGTMFNLNRFTKAPAIYDIHKLNHINGEHLRRQPLEKIVSDVEKVLPLDHPFHLQSADWKLACMNLFKDKILLYTELSDYLKILFENVVGEDADYLEAKSWETTPLIKAYLAGEIAKEKALGKKFVTEADYNNWSNHVKNELKIKGKQLFMGMRSVLTLQAHGPDLKFIIPLTSLDILETRLK